MRKCRNWQTSKTKDLVLATACGFKSHLPHEKRESEDSLFSFLIIIIIIQQIIRFLWNGSSAGMSVRLTRERSWVRTPSVPLRRPCVKPGTWKCPDFTQGLLCMHINMYTKKEMFQAFRKIPEPGAQISWQEKATIIGTIERISAEYAVK